MTEREQVRFSRLIEPSPEMSDEVEEHLRKFEQKLKDKQQAEGVQVIHRGLVWYIKRLVPKEQEQRVISRVQISFFHTERGRGVGFIPSVSLESGPGKGILVQPSIPLEAIRGIDRLPRPNEWDLWFGEFDRQLEATWETAEEWGKEPRTHATELFRPPPQRS